MRDSERRQHLTDHNPWWVSRDWERSDRDLRDARLNAVEHYDPRPLGDIGGGSLYLFMGPRRVGKSVSVKRRIAELIAGGADPRQIVFCPCETLKGQDLRRIIALTADLTPDIEDHDRYWFFDEITYVPNWRETLKQLRDQSALRDGTVVVTGSSATKLREALGDLGDRLGPSGGVRVLLPMSFRAFAKELYPELAANLPDEVLHRDDIQTESSQRYWERLRLFVDQVTLAWERYVLIGGFPRAVADVKNGIDVQRATADGMWDILTGDVLHVGEMSDRDVKHFITALTDTLSSFLNVTSLSSTLSIGTRHTVENRIDRLCKSFFAWRVQTSHDGSTVVKGSHDKLYFIDPLIARLPSLRSSGVAGPDVTKLAEQALGVTLMRTILKEDVRPILDEDALLVRRNPDSGAEIDFVGPHLATPVESKYVSDKWKPEKKALTEHYGRGVIVTRDILDMTEDIWAVPAGLFAWALDD